MVVRGHQFHNLSCYGTRELVVWVLAAFRACGVRTPKRVVFTMSPIYSRGCAETSSDRPNAVISIALARPGVASRRPRAHEFDYARLSNLLRHECTHLLGVDHDSMRDESLLYSEGPLQPWARGLPRLRVVRSIPDQVSILKG